MTSPGTRARSVRVPDDLWDTARRISQAEGTPLSDVIRESLERYVETHRSWLHFYRT
jgi:predicted DNA-binding protein